MTTVNPVPWITLARGGLVVPCLLIAGYPHPILPPGERLTDVTWTGGSDAAWHAGTSGITPKGWLDVPTGRADDPPHLVLEERASPAQQELDISALDLTLCDPRAGSAGEVSRLLSSRGLAPATALTAALAQSATTMTVEGTAGFASSGDLYLGREVIGYSGVTSTTFTGLTRGKYGTRDRQHLCLSELQRPVVYGNPASWTALPSVIGRRATLWLLPMNGTTATDPQLVFDGRVGPGLSLRGAGWSLPIVHVVRTLEAKLRQTQVTLQGFKHGSNPSGTAVVREPTEIDEPLAARWGDGVMALGPGDGDGWSASREIFLHRWDQIARTVISSGSYQIRGTLRPDGKVNIRGTDGSAHALMVVADWMQPPRVFSPGSDASTTDTDVTATTPQAMPTAFVPLSGLTRFLPADFAQIPAVPSLPGEAATTGTTAYFTLRAKIGGADRVARITSVASPNVNLSPVEVPENPRDLTALAPTPATLGLWCASNTWHDALRYGILPSLDGWQGLDHITDSIAWDRVRSVVSQSPSAIDARRRYDISLDGDGVLSVIKNECALNGLVLCTYRGRLSVARIHEIAGTEPMAATITSGDLRKGEVPTLTEVSDGLVTAWTLSLPEKRSLRIVDVVGEDEAGRGGEIHADGSAIRADLDLLDPAVVSALTTQAMAVLGPFAQNYQMVTLPLTLAHVGLQIGDAILVSDWLLPSGSGTRGLSAVPCCVLGIRRGITEGRVDVDALVSRTDLAGYAPECLIGAISGAVLTVDTTALGSDQGPRGFCDPFLPDGSPRTDGGASTFAVGDKVALHELDSETPATPETFTVVSVSGTSITLDGSPTSAFTSIVSPGVVKVLLAFDGYSAATAAQKRYCYIAEHTTLEIGGADPARRYGN